MSDYKEESVKYRDRKNQPATELHERKGKKPKKSAKKPWVLNAEWRPEKVFAKSVHKRIDGKWTNVTVETKTWGELKDIQMDFSEKLSWGSFWLRPSNDHYKTKKAAMDAWNNFKTKTSYLKTSNFDYCPDEVIYTLTNIQTGEIIEL